MSEVFALTYFELDLKRCSLSYGIAPCTATLEGSDATGTKKCYNSPNTCQDPANFTPSILTLRFAISTDYLPDDIDCIPSIKSVSTKGQVLNPGESLGERETATVSFNDHPFNDVGIDKYYSERGFDPFTKGTFWAKFVARWPYIQGSACRVIRGYLGEALEDMETRHYVVDTTSGPDSDGSFSITAKDSIKLLDGDKSQAPRASKGVLDGAIDNNDVTITLAPAGIGNIEYPTSGVASIGDEQVTFTRSGDTVTLTARGVDFSEASDHEAGETFQLGIYYNGVDPADIIYDLITNYSGIPGSMIDLPDWQTETSVYINRVYTAKILKPTSARDLINELINQVGLVIYTDTINQKIILRALRQFIPLVTIDDSLIIEESFDLDEQQDKRVSQVWTYFGQKNPLNDLSEVKNYRSISVTIGSDSVSALEGRQEAIRKIFSRWITVFNRPAAESLNDIIIQRYRNAPKKASYQLGVTENPILASAVTLSNRNIQDDEGDPSTLVAQIISLNKDEARYSVVAEQMTFVQQAATDRLIVIDQDTFNFNLREAHDQIYTEPESGDNVFLTIQPGVKVGSTNSGRAFDVGNWPAGVNITIIINNSRVQGRGGRGGSNGSNPGDGSIAFYTRYPVTIDNLTGEIWGGAGGGAYGRIDINSPPAPIALHLDWGGGGGAGYTPGPAGSASLPGGTDGSPGTTESGGNGGSPPLGNGGGPGEDGLPGLSAQTPGTAGAAVDGESFITYTNEGDIRGPRIN